MIKNIILNNFSRLNLKLKFNIKMDQLGTEAEVGISTFLNQGFPIKGIFKYRMSDFVVNEIEQSTKKVLYLDKGEISQIKAKIKLKKQSIQRKFQEQDEAQLRDFFKEEAETVLKFYDDLETGDQSGPFDFKIHCADRATRIQIHEFVREKMPYFDSKTDQNSQITIFFTKNQAKKQKKSLQLVQAIMMKKGIDTLSACSKVNQLLRFSQITTAGIKDKRGITTQLLTFKGSIEDVDQLNYRLSCANFSDNIQFSSFKIVDKMLRIGDLYGNRFSLAIRLFNFEEEQLQKNIENLRANGFINYFGTQRFGNANLGRSHIVGAHILKADYRMAFDSILTVDKHDSILFQAMEAYKQDLDSKKILNILPNKNKIERQLIEAAAKNGPKNFFNTICSIPRQRRNLYLHSFQSYIWNQLASTRIERYGNKVVVGDIVTKQKQIIEEKQADVDDNDALESDEEQGGYKGINSFQTEVINEENIQQYNINDVVLPLLGSDTQLPQGFLLGAELIQLLDQNQISMLNYQKLGKEFFVEGGYRFLIQHAEDIKVNLIKFDDKKQDLVAPFYPEEEDVNIEEGKFSALILRFSLSKGSYATMLMRELTKMSSSYDSQIELNQQYEQF